MMKRLSMTCKLRYKREAWSNIEEQCLNNKNILWKSIKALNTFLMHTCWNLDVLTFRRKPRSTNKNWELSFWSALSIWMNLKKLTLMLNGHHNSSLKSRLMKIVEKMVEPLLLYTNNTRLYQGFSLPINLNILLSPPKYKKMLQINCFCQRVSQPT